MVVVIYNNKGGVGKSTLTAHTAFQAMERRVPLTVIDADQQCNTMSWLCGHDWDGAAEYQQGSVTVTTDGKAFGDGLTVIDAPPSFSFVQSYPSADVWVIPVGGRFSVDGALNVVNQVHQVNKNARVVLVANMCDPNTKFGKMELEQIRKVDVELFQLPIPRHDVVRKAELMGKPAWSVPYGVRANTAVNLQTFADWVLRGCPEKGVYS